MKDKLFVIIPAHNEQKHIGLVIEKVKKYTKNIIVVDDGSTDNTFNIAKNEKITVLRHIINTGKGAALKTGCIYALKKGAEKLIFIDADGQHEPKEIPRFLKELKNAEIVFGSRTFNEKMPVIFKFGNKVINSLNKLLFGIKLRDTQSGYRAIRADAYKKIKWNSSDYSVEAEMVAKAGKKKLKYKEIGIKTIYSDRYKGTTVIDGIKIVLNMLWWRISRW
jgi:glycosyltransferase involved in cell wall biosynthesis